MLKSFYMLFLYWITLLAASAATHPESPTSARVSPGIERLREPQTLTLLKGKRLGIIAHGASRDTNGTHLVDLLTQELGLDLKVIFAPEHGIRSKDDAYGEDSKDPKTGVPVFSLYKAGRKAPTYEQLAKIDLLLIDLQDVGVRYYTYGSTMALAMDAAENARVAVWVLDRPNPLGTAEAQGSVLDPTLTGHLISYFPVQTLHAMTLGELALFHQNEAKRSGDLKILPIKNWKHSDDWTQTRLHWAPPSPALPEAHQALSYSVTGVLESYNLAVGRGTDNSLAFEIIGAPWISKQDQLELVQELNALHLPGFGQGFGKAAGFEKFQWTPTRAIFQGKPSRGFRMRIKNPALVQPFEATIQILKTLHRVLGAKLQATATTPRFLGGPWVLDSILKQDSFDTIQKRVEAESLPFKAARKSVLLYP